MSVAELFTKSKTVTVSEKIPSEVQLNKVAVVVWPDSLGVPKVQPEATKVEVPDLRATFASIRTGELAFTWEPTASVEFNLRPTYT